MSELTLEQALHGYTQGHGLLAASPGVNGEERALLGRLSDLSGYLPTGFRFDQYHTGFPCGRYYALCCTWPDPEAPRGGAVMTHSLLVPLGELGDPSALDRMMQGLRRPRSVRAIQGYDQRLHLLAPLEVAPPVLVSERVRAAVALLFGSAARPIVWVDPARPDDVVRALWSLLWPEARRELSFCTLALSPRQVAGRVFTFLGVPPEARGAFSNLGAHPTWWDNGKIRDPELAARVAEPWVDQVTRGGPSAVAEMIGRARAVGIEVRPEDLPLILRLEELAAGARERLTAARSRADLLARRLPQLALDHPWWREALTALVDRQADAPLRPRPLWDLTDLLSRPATQALAADLAFHGRVEDLLVRELSRRLREAPSETCEGLPALLAAARPGWAASDALGSALGHAVARATDLDQAIRVAGTVLAKVDSESAAQAVLRPLPPEARSAALDQAFQQGPADEIMPRLARAAEALGDPELAFRIGVREGGEPGGLALAARVATLGDEAPRTDTLAALLARVGPRTALNWALDVEDARLSRFAAVQGALAAIRGSLSMVDLGRTVLDHPNGAAVFVEAANRATPEELRAAFTADPALVALVLERGEGSVTPALRESLRAAAVELPALLQRQVLTPEAAAGWLASAEVRSALERASRWTLFRVTGQPGPRLLEPLLDALALLPADVSVHPLVEIIALALQNVDRGGLERATAALVGLIGRVGIREDRAVIMGEALGAVRRLLPQTGAELVKACFPAVYAAVRDGVRFPFNLLSWWFDTDWDRAKKWRHWLVDAWLEAGWAPLDLIRTVDATAGSDKLFGQVAKRAWRTREGEALMRRAYAQLGDAPALMGRWRGPMERLMREGPPWVEYD